MPTYEYRCTKCKYEFEKFQAMSDPSVRKCPKCGKLSVERMISIGAGIIFKGSGFYATDYKKKDNRKPSKEDKDKKGCSSCSPSPNSCKTCKK